MRFTKPYDGFVTTEPTNPLEVRMARLEGSFEQINLRLTSLETQVSDVRSDIRSLYTVTMVCPPDQPMLVLVDDDELARRRDRRAPRP